MGLQLDDFQHDTLSFLDHARGRAVVADPMGARKTGTVLAWLAQLAEGRDTSGGLPRNADRTLVVAPSSVHGHWAREAERFFLFAVVRHGSGSKAKRAAALDDVQHILNPTLYITTYESMKQDQYAIERANFESVVFDEGHRLKGRRTEVALCANSVVKKPAHLIIVTGTPVLNHAAELWQYLHMIAPRVYPAFWRWAEEHYVIEVKYFRDNRFPTRIIHDFREGHEEIVRNQIAPFFIQRDIAELFPNAPWIEEPEHIELPVELSTGERKLFDNLVEFKWGILGGREITTKNSLDLTTRLTQISSDWGTIVPDAELGTKAHATVEQCMNLLERDEPVLIFAKYKATVNRIQRALQAKHVHALAYHGDLDAADRDATVTMFKQGHLKVIVGTLDSLSEGVDGLQELCSNIIMVDRWWTPAKNEQAIGRLRRSGQLRKVTVYHIFAVDTIDQTITAACLRKTNVIQLLKGKPLIDAIYGRV
jgi:SNF2 family DNA or RNA helicase